MAETREQMIARIAERKRVDDEMATKLAVQRSGAPANPQLNPATPQPTSVKPQLTPEEIRTQQAAARRKAITDQTAPSGYQSLLRSLGLK